MTVSQAWIVNIIQMAHSERYEDGLFQNIPGQKDQKLFESAVRYFQAGQDNTGL